MKPALTALALCAIAAVLEGVAAGPGVKQRLASLRAPRWALSFGAWLVVGGIYYVVCFAVLFRLLRLPPSALRTTALVMTMALMAANAAFNFVFFRRGDLRSSFLFFLPYSALALGLFVVLLRADPVAAAIFGPYLVYFVYATAWGYQIWQLNRGAGPDDRSSRPCT